MAKSGQPVNGFAMAVMVEGGLAVVGIVLAWLFGVRLRELIPSQGPEFAVAVARGVLVTLPLLAVFYWLVHSSRSTVQQLRRQVESLIGEMFPAASVAQFALIALLAGAGEELLFRGVMQSLLSQWTTPLIGLILTSLLFGLAHALSKLYFVLATLIGLCFGWLVLRYHDLIAPMVAHSLYDFIALVYISQRVGRAAVENDEFPKP
jgi:membrane protease YdiL (CAAX protease family)